MPYVPYRPSQAWAFAVPEVVPQTQLSDPFILPSTAINDLPERVHKQADKRKGRTKKQCSKSEGLTSENPHLLSLVRETVLMYRITSAHHFDMHINLELKEESHLHAANNATSSCRLKVLLSIWEINICRVCRLQFYKDGRAGKVQVREKGRWVPLIQSLAIHFPPNDSALPVEAMQRYWAGNGKVFSWAALPTELKEHVLQFCICTLTSYADDFHDLPATSTSANRRDKLPTCEIVERLGDWKYLLLVSTQVRAITLRLCFNGSITFPKGFCLTSIWHYDFQRRIKRLDKRHQMTEPNSVVSQADFRTTVLARRYKKYPRYYPELKRYATFKHGIRKLCLEFGFSDFLHFFKVDAGGFDRYRPVNFMTCDVLEQLPQLNALVILLPTGAQRTEDTSRQCGLTIFHEYAPCPRTLHRLIYERVAEELAHYRNLKVKNFIDSDEEERFWILRESARLALRFTEDELEELYADVEGGVELEDEYDSITETSQSKTASTSSVFGDTPIKVFPPRCHCAYPCWKIFIGCDSMDDES